MHKDDISDAEFEAFLKGEDALSRELQAMAQAAPAPALDDAVLRNAERLMAAEARPPAANDSFATRWRVPVGIAATILAGVVGHQVFEANRQPDWQAGTVEPKVMVLEETPAQSAVEAPPPPRAATAPPAAVEAESMMPPPPPEVRMQPAPPPPPPPAAPAAAPAPAPAAVDSVIAEDVGRFPDTDVQAAAKAAVQSRVDEFARAAPAPPSPAAPDQRPAGPVQRSPEQWIEMIDGLLKANLNRAALEEWRKFRQAYPDQAVPDELARRIKAAGG